ncbi:MAG: RHS repeat-associated core domain-containing protein [Verrucomicrobiota bacterium]|nr:RHS repeat-associated core domain-containing protein [Verrucomicrobiota bacterium]
MNNLIIIPQNYTYITGNPTPQGFNLNAGATRNVTVAHKYIKPDTETQSLTTSITVYFSDTPNNTTSFTDTLNVPALGQLNVNNLDKKICQGYQLEDEIASVKSGLCASQYGTLTTEITYTGEATGWLGASVLKDSVSNNIIGISTTYINEEALPIGTYYANVTVRSDSTTIGSYTVALKVEDPAISENCTSCANECGSCDGGEISSADLGSLDYRFALRKDQFGGASGAFHVKSRSSVLKKENLSFTVSLNNSQSATATEYTYDLALSDHLRQVTAGGSFIDIQYNTGDITALIYPRSARSATKTSGYYTITGGTQPYGSIKFVNSATNTVTVEERYSSTGTITSNPDRERKYVYSYNLTTADPDGTATLAANTEIDKWTLKEHYTIAGSTPYKTTESILTRVSKGNYTRTKNIKNSAGTVEWKEIKYFPSNRVYLGIPNNTASDFFLSQWEEALPTQIDHGNESRTFTYAEVPTYDNRKEYKVASIINPDKNWIKYEYNYNTDFGSVVTTKEITPYDNSLSTDAAENAHRVTSYAYSVGSETIESIDHNYKQIIATSKVKGTVAKTVTTRAYTPPSSTDYDEIKKTITSHPGAPDVTVIEKWKTTTLSGIPLGRKLIYKSEQDGTQAAVITKITYALSSGNLVTTTKTGLWAVADLSEGTITEVQTNPDGQQVSFTQTHKDAASEMVLQDVFYSDFDVHGRPQTTTYFGGTDEERVESVGYGCCGIMSRTTPEGEVTYTRGEETRNGVVRLYKTETRSFDQGDGTIKALTTISYYNSRGDVIEQIQKDFDDVVGRPLGKWTYATSGQLTDEKTALDFATGYVQTYDTTAILWKKTTTLPDATTDLRWYNREGNLVKVSGTGTLGRQYAYSVLVESSVPYEITKELWLNADQSATVLDEWTETWIDPLGRTYKTVRSHEAGDAITAYEYDGASSRVTKITDPEGQVTVNVYNSMKELVETRILYDHDDAVDSSKKDRKTTYAMAYDTVTETLPDSLGSKTYVVERMTTTSYTTNGSDVGLATVTERSVGGNFSKTTSLGLTQKSFTVTAPATATRTQYAVSSNGGVQTSLSRYGLPLSQEVKNEAGDTISLATYTYDNYARVATVTDGRTNTQTYAYYADDTIQTVTTGESSTGAADARQTYYEYSSRGLKTLEQIRNAANAAVLGKTEYAYYANGLLKKAVSTLSGYPSEYTYDYAGRRLTLKTWKGYNFTTPANSTDDATTTWAYHPKSGLLQTKTYPAVSGQENSTQGYTWRKDGRLNTQTNGRGQVTTYSYTALGDLDTIEYDAAHAGKEIDYNYYRDGRIDTITDASGTRMQSYDANGFPQTESYTSGALKDWGLTRTWDDGRLASLTLQKTGSDALPTVNYNYTKPGTALDAGRLTSVTQGSLEFAQSYESQSMLNAGVNAKHSGSSVLNTTQTHDNWGRLSTYASGSQSYNYSTNQIDRREIVLRENGEYWHYQYDNLGQVTSAKRYKKSGVEPAPTTDTAVLGNAFDYAFDTIGNRTQTTAFGHNTTWAAADARNQLTSRTVPGFATVLGEANTMAEVTLNAAPVQRQEEDARFFGEFVVDNSAAAQYPTLEIKATMAGIGLGGTNATVTDSGHQFIAKTPEVFTYDKDGNLTQDGRWNYTWNALNQMTQMQTRTPAPTGTPQQRLDFAYDCQGRRISKAVSLWNPTTSNYQPTTTFYFLYDGWNLIQELKTVHGTPNTTNAKRFVWGLDMSGTLQGAGGVQGLLAIADDNTAKTYLTKYDGHGNVMGLVDSVTGATVANYEYGAFGEPIRATGAAASINPFRFSTKYLDAETGLYYYGLRYYDSNLGRWLRKDPIEENGGLNLYGFIDNNPITYVDVFGLGALPVSPPPPIYLVPKPVPGEIIQFPVPKPVPGISGGGVAGTGTGIVSGAIGIEIGVGAIVLYEALVYLPWRMQTTGSPLPITLQGPPNPWAVPLPIYAQPKYPNVNIPSPFLPKMDNEIGIDPISKPVGPHQDPGKDNCGKCNPCPPNVIWTARGSEHGSTNGFHVNYYRWDQNPTTCKCFFSRLGARDLSDVPPDVFARPYIIIPGTY